MRTNAKGKTVVIVATLDTRGDEVAYLQAIIEQRGHQALIIDVGVLGEPSIVGDYSRAEVAQAGGSDIAALVRAAAAGADRKEATDVMIAGAQVIVTDLLARGKLDAIMGLGGSTAAATGAAIMNGLPFGLPKLLLTTFITLAPIGEEDITVMQSPVDLVGLNRIVAQTLANAAGAITGMVEQEVPAGDSRKLVGITALGVTTPLVQKAIARLDRRGYDSIVFHATTAKLDRMAREGMVDFILDLTSFETVPRALYAPELLSMLPGSSGADRMCLGCAVERPIPQIIAPGGLDMHIFPGLSGIEDVAPEYQNRAWSMHGPNVVLVRTSQEEMSLIAESIAERANRAAGPVAVVIPLRGFSEASRQDAPLFDPASDRSFIEGLKDNLAARIDLSEIDCHINDDAFADLIAQKFDSMTA